MEMLVASDLKIKIIKSLWRLSASSIPQRSSSPISYGSASTYPIQQFICQWENKTGPIPLLLFFWQTSLWSNWRMSVVPWKHRLTLVFAKKKKCNRWVGWVTLSCSLVCSPFWRVWSTVVSFGCTTIWLDLSMQVFSFINWRVWGNHIGTGFFSKKKKEIKQNMGFHWIRCI